MYKIGVMGGRETVMGFKALGLDVFPVDSADEAQVLVLETDETVQVQTPGTILAVSAGGNVSVTGKKQAAVADGGLSYIIYK